MAWKLPSLNRRAFLKTAGYGGAGLGLLTPIGQLAGKSGAEQTTDADGTSYSICNFCSSLCNLRVTTQTRNGVKRITKLAGNPHSTLNRGKICARGQSGLRQTYDTDRLKTPLIRVEGSKRGEWAFRAASWEEAWQYIEAKSRKAEIQPYEWTMVGGWTSCVFYMSWAVPFAMANAIPNIIASPMQHCVTTGHIGTDMVTGNFNIHDEVLPDYDNAKYILFVANNSSIGAVSTCRMVRFATGRKRGAKVVALDPRRSETAAKADEWLAIRPGTDLDFMLAMLKVMMDEGYYDALFLKQHSNMPFLLYRDSDGEWQPLTDAEGRPQVLSEGSERLHSLSAYSNRNSSDVDGNPVDPALRAPDGFEIDGKPVVTVFQAQLSELEGRTPEWAAKSTGIDAETIRRIAFEFGTTRPAIVDPGWHGARYQNMMMLRRVQAMIQMLTGGIDKQGGWIMSGEFHHKAAQMIEAREKGEPAGPPFAALAGMPFAKFVVETFSDGNNFPHGRPGWAWAYSAQERAAGREYVALPVMADTGLKESVEGTLSWNGESYRTRAVLINAANPVRHYYPDTRWKEILGHPDMELVVAVDVLPADTTLWADVILPNSSYLERDEPALYGNGVNHDLALTTRYAAIDPLYDTEETPDILLRMSNIISGSEYGLLQWVEKLTGLPAEVVKERYAQKRTQMEHGAFSAACREVYFEQTAQRLHTTPEAIDQTLRERGIYQEQEREALLEHAAMPRKLPLPSESGRVEFFAPLFHALRQGGNRLPNFNVLGGHIEAQCRPDTPMDMPLAGDEFYFTYGKTPTVSYASTNSNNPVLAAINQFKREIYGGVWIHPDRAEALGIRTGDRLLLRNTATGQQTEGDAYVTRLIRRDTLFIHSSFGSENPKLTRAYGFGTATSKLIPYRVEPVVAGFRSQEFTIKVSKLHEKGGVA
ncbi:molybdopterin-dependent oxidoreductase [Sedimenticola hydrogenitrophicus]|uniref:molybdopterin-dependent oxidoreductase n=1 Tax=Sedimenticola hydrogenitrophicus TaxID=2967975 RepID=UPI0023B12127|nr:molybdopterin-dependent oxidoreductase [Sedimenticola hydrogenitrophicus]